MKKLTYDDLENMDQGQPIIFDGLGGTKTIGVFIDFSGAILNMLGDMFGGPIDDELSKEIKEEQENPKQPFDFETGFIEDGEITGFGSGTLSIPRDKEEAKETIESFNIRILEEGDEEYELCEGLVKNTLEK